jgi:uracil DNA glycosylase
VELETMNQKNGKVNAEALKQKIKKIKVLNGTLKQKMTVSRLKAMKGFEHLTDEVAKEVIDQLQEMVSIICGQLNRTKLNRGL